MWYRFENGSTAGQRGSEEGIIVRDEEHECGARITLERDCSRKIPFAITCGVYGWFVHTRFLSSDADSEFVAMKDGLSEIIEQIPLADSPDADANSLRVTEAIQAFVERHP